MPDKLQELSETLSELLDQLHVLVRKPQEIEFEIIEDKKKEGYSTSDNPLKHKLNLS